jgi:hypothetical protein
MLRLLGIVSNNKSHLSVYLNHKIKKMNSKLFVALLVIMLFATACKNDKKDDVTNDVNKEGSIETAVTVEHADSTNDVIVTKHKVWRNLSEYKTIEYRDTIPALGVTNVAAENEEGDTKSVRIKKEYEIFITVK